VAPSVEQMGGGTGVAAGQSGGSNSPGGPPAQLRRGSEWPDTSTARLDAGACLRSRMPSVTLKARVWAGRLVVDEPTDLPQGTEVERLPLDPGDWLDDADRAALHDAASASDAPLPRHGRSALV
jgi:hypothetical protein